MSKKRKRTKNPESTPDVDVAAPSAPEPETPFDDVDASAELDEDVPTRMAERAPLRSVGTPEADPHGESIQEAPPENAFDDRFDFGDERARLAAEVSADDADALPAPPDPGSADAASPRLQSIVESLLFAADRPLNLRQLADLVEEPEVERIRAAVLAVEQSWGDRGVQLHEVAGGYQFRTHPANAIWVQKLLQAKPVRLSRALLETLAIAAYRQPITRPEIDEIRGVDSGGTLKTLMDRALVRILGKKEEPGRPLLYGTTKEFLEFFSLRDLKDLPTLREYHELSDEHQAQVAALEGVAPEGAILPAGESAEDELPELPKLSRLEISAPKEDAAELEEIDRLIRSAGVGIATDSDLPGDAAATEEPPEEIVVTAKFDSSTGKSERFKSEREKEFDEEREQTGTFGIPLDDAIAKIAEPGDFENEERTRLRPGDLDALLIDDRDPDKEPSAD